MVVIFAAEQLSEAAKAMQSGSMKLGVSALSILLSCPCAIAQLRPQVTEKSKKKTVPEAAQIMVETSPNAEVYLDDQYTGRASPEGRLVIANPRAGEHALRVSMPGKKDFECKVTVVAGQMNRIAAPLAEFGPIPGASKLPATVAVGGSTESTPKSELVLRLAATEPVWVWVEADGQEALQRVLHPNEVTTLKAKDHFDLTTGNAQGLVLTLNGETLRPLGREGEVKKVHLTREDVTIDAALTDIEKPLPVAGSLRENPKDGLKYVWIPPGRFEMGCSPGDSECGAEEKPAHQVTLTKGFWISQTEVTVQGYRKFVGSTGAEMPAAPSFNAGWDNQDMPIVNVSWDDATAFCGWAGGRLPTEAEWEYAARAGKTEARYGSLDEVAWYSANSGRGAHPVGEKRANGFGLHDTLGNVWEWVNDWYGENYYPASPERDPRGPDRGQLRVLRGGSWFYDPRYVRVSYRNRDYPALRNNYIGVRCAREVDIP